MGETERRPASGRKARGEGVAAGDAAVAVEPMGVDGVSDFVAELEAEDTTDSAAQTGTGDGAYGGADWAGDETGGSADFRASGGTAHRSGNAAGGTNNGADGASGIAADVAFDHTGGLTLGTGEHEVSSE